MTMYKILTLELLQHDYPALYEQLKSNRTLMTALDHYASLLKTRLEYWLKEYGQANPDRDRVQLSSIALEDAIADLRESLRSDSPPSPQDDGVFHLEAAVAYLRQHTPPA